MQHEWKNWLWETSKSQFAEATLGRSDSTVRNMTQLLMNGCDFYCNKIFKLVPRWANASICMGTMLKNT
jgi:hypothetical protein